MKNNCSTIALSLFLLSCGNGTQKKEPVIYDEPIVEQVKPDSVATAVQNEAPKVEEEPSVPVSSSSSSRSYNSSSNDNMRGFDPASEDDMDDNGMSRYMENNDDEGWE